jgi:hypothetical protein
MGHRPAGQQSDIRDSGHSLQATGSEFAPVILQTDHNWHDPPHSSGTAASAAPVNRMTQPRASVDWPLLLLGAMGTGGAVTALIQDEWLWGAIIFLGSIVAELLVIVARRRRARRAQTP